MMLKKAAKNDISLYRKIAKLKSKISLLEKDRETTELHKKQKQQLSLLQQQIESATGESAVLLSLIDLEKKSSNLIKKKKEAYRLQYRDYIRGAKIGNIYEQITSRLGKEYHDVCVTDVTPMGVAISHRNGATLLGYRQMPKAWQEELMYSAIEMEEATKADQENQSIAIREITRRALENTKAQKKHTRINEIAALKRQIAVISMNHLAAGLEMDLAKNKMSTHQSLRESKVLASSSYSYNCYNRATDTYSSARYTPRYRVSYIGSKSVPGSLQTWENRILRSERTVASYALKLQHLKTRLSELVASEY